MPTSICKIVSDTRDYRILRGLHGITMSLFSSKGKDVKSNSNIIYSSHRHTLHLSSTCQHRANLACTFEATLPIEAPCGAPTKHSAIVRDICTIHPQSIMSQSAVATLSSTTFIKEQRHKYQLPDQRTTIDHTDRVRFGAQ